MCILQQWSVTGRWSGSNVGPSFKAFLRAGLLTTERRGGWAVPVGGKGFGQGGGMGGSKYDPSHGLLCVSLSGVGQESNWCLGYLEFMPLTTELRDGGWWLTPGC